MVHNEKTGQTTEVVREADKKYVGSETDEPSTLTPEPKAPRRTPEKKEETGEIDFAEEREKMIGARGAKTTGPGGTGGVARTHAAAPSSTGGMKEYDADHRTINFKVPVNWTEVPGAFDYGDEANKALMDGFVVAYSGSRDDMKLVVQQVFDAGGSHGEGTDEIVRGYAEALKKRTLAAFPQAELKADVSVMAGQKGRRIAYFAVTTKVGDRDLTVARYCGYTTKTAHMVTFVCRSEDYDALSPTFLKVVATVWW